MPNFNMKQKFLQWQYADLLRRIADLGNERESLDNAALMTAMEEEKSRMEAQYLSLYGVAIPNPPPPPPPWW